MTVSNRQGRIDLLNGAVQIGHFVQQQRGHLRSEQEMIDRWILDKLKWQELLSDWLILTYP